MLDGFTGVLWSTEEEGVGSGWRALGQLVDGEAFTSSLENAGAGCSSKAEGGDGQLWKFEETMNRLVSDETRDYEILTNRVSSVILATTTMVLSLWVFCACSLPAVATMRERDMGGPECKL
jgi:hypothetical protein